MDYETFGEHQSESTGIMEFMSHLPEAVRRNPRRQDAYDDFSGKIRQRIPLLPAVHIVHQVHFLEPAGQGLHIGRLAQEGDGAFGPYDSGVLDPFAEAGCIGQNALDQFHRRFLYPGGLLTGTQGCNGQYGK